QGGAIANLEGATLSITDSLLIHNRSLGADGSGPGGQGSGIHNTASRVSIAHSTLMANLAQGGRGGNAAGGGINNVQGASLTVTDSMFIGNQAISGDGGVGGATNLLVACPRGGGIYNNQATLTVENTTFIGNQALAGNGAVGGSANPTFVDSATGGG